MQLFILCHVTLLLYLQSSDSKVNRRLSDNEGSAFEEKLEEPVHRKESATPATTTNKAKV